jgi:hypothetical protein
MADFFGRPEDFPGLAPSFPDRLAHFLDRLEDTPGIFKRNPLK